MKRWISLLLVLTMMFSYCGGIGVTVFADEPNESTIPVEVSTSEESTVEESTVEESMVVESTVE